MKHRKYLTQGEKLKKTMIAKYGSEAKYRKAMREHASKSKRNPEGRGGILDITDEERRELARLGGIARHEKDRAKREAEAPTEDPAEDDEETDSEEA